MADTRAIFEAMSHDLCDKYQPLYSITQDCVLCFPDANNYAEFPVICPAHGTLSKPFDEIQNENTCENSCRKHCPNNVDTALEIDSMLSKIWRGDASMLQTYKIIPGSPADTKEKHLQTFMGESLACRPKSPVVLDSHSLRAKRIEECKQKKININGIHLECFYQYVHDLVVPGEIDRLFLSEIRHVAPGPYAQRPAFKFICVARTPKDTSNLIVKVLPRRKCFVIYIDYAHFTDMPEIHFGDQILEINHSFLNLIDDQIQHKNGRTKFPDKFFIWVRPCPYLRWIKIYIRKCRVFQELPDGNTTLKNAASILDLGFTIINGNIVHVAPFSPAEEAGLQPDYQITEVNNQCVVRSTDDQIIRSIRKAIHESVDKTVEIVVMPKRIYDCIVDSSRGSLYEVYSNKGFCLNSWVDSLPFGLRPSGIFE